MNWDDPDWRAAYLTKRAAWPDVVCTAAYAVLLIGGAIIVTRTIGVEWNIWQWLACMLLVGALGYYGVHFTDQLAERWISVIMAHRWQAWWRYLAQYYDLGDVTWARDEETGRYIVDIELIAREGLADTAQVDRVEVTCQTQEGEA